MPQIEVSFAHKFRTSERNQDEASFTKLGIRISHTVFIHVIIVCMLLHA